MPGKLKMMCLPYPGRQFASQKETGIGEHLPNETSYIKKSDGHDTNTLRWMKEVFKALRSDPRFGNLSAKGLEMVVQAGHFRRNISMKPLYANGGVEPCDAVHLGGYFPEGGPGWGDHHQVRQW